MEFTYEEKIATSKMAAIMMYADGKVEQTEQVIVASVFGKFKLSKSDIEEVNKMDKVVALMILSQMDTQKKRIVSAILGTIMIVDGNIASDELKLWRFVANVCEFPILEIDDCSQIAVNFLY